MEDTTNKQKTYTISLTEQEIREELAELDRDEDVTLFLKVQNGGKKFEKLIKFSKLLEQDESKK